LNQVLKGTELTYCLFRWPALGGADLTGQQVLNVWAYGKHLLMDLDSGYTFRSHLRMDGAWLLEAAEEGHPVATSRAHAWTTRAVLANQNWVALGHLLGMADLFRPAALQSELGRLGPDLMADGVDLEIAAARVLDQGERGIGATLLDQRVIAGIGTIYMAESLFHWRVHPERPANQVPHLPGLLAKARELLWRSVKSRTPTATGLTIRGQTTLVHGRHRLPCRRCSTPIQVTRVGTAPRDRPAFYCPTCQPN
jgi:endonuclease-8